MKKYLAVLGLVCGASMVGSVGATPASGESFTFTRNYDQKVFYCSEQPGSIPNGILPGRALSLMVCDCGTDKDSYGQVIARSENLDDLQRTCSARSSFQNLNLKNCRGITTHDQGIVSCECVARDGASKGQVMARVNEVDKIFSACSSKSSFQSVFPQKCHVN